MGFRHVIGNIPIRAVEPQRDIRGTGTLIVEINTFDVVEGQEAEFECAVRNGEDLKPVGSVAAVVDFTALHVIGPDLKIVSPLACILRILANPTVQDVIIVATEQLVVTGPAIQAVIAFKPDQGIVAKTTGEDVSDLVPGQRIGPEPARCILDQRRDIVVVEQRIEDVATGLAARRVTVEISQLARAEGRGFPGPQIDVDTG